MEDKITSPCQQCQNGQSLGFEFTMAFQPIVDLRHREIFAYEALARGTKGESAFSVISQVNENNRYLFDQACRVKAISLAAKLGMTQKLSINFLPNAVYEPKRCIRATLQEARRVGFPTSQIMFEITEVEQVIDHDHLNNIFEYYKSQGFVVALDDFGAGFSGLNTLADLEPNIVKLDMGLIRNINASRKHQIIVSNSVRMLKELRCTVIAEGVESRAELECLRAMGIDLFQGYLFAKPALENLPLVDLSAY